MASEKASTPCFKVTGPLHLGLSLKVGATYSLGDLEGRCSGDEEKLKKLNNFVKAGVMLVPAAQEPEKESGKPARAPKRTAAASAGSTRKKARLKTSADPIAPKCARVVEGIELSKALSVTCKEMLCGMVTTSLTVYADQRHAYQATAVTMIEESLEVVRQQLKDAVGKLQDEVVGSDAQKASRNAEFEQAEASQSELESKVTNAKQAVEQNKESVASAEKEVEAVSSEIDDFMTDAATMTGRKADLQKAVEVWASLQSSKTSGAAGRKAVEDLTRVFTQVGVEPGLVDCLPDLLKKEPSARATFGSVAGRAVEEQATRCMHTIEEALQTAEKGAAGLTDKKAVVDAALVTAKEQLRASESALQEAKAALKEGKGAVRTAKAQMREFSREKDGMSNELEEAKEALKDFETEVLASFALLKDLAAIVEAPHAETADAADAASKDERDHTHGGLADSDAED